jgi:hypothetical protein
MEMRIGSGSAMAMQSNSLTQANQKQKHVSNLFSALESGDLASAQKSYSALGLSSGTSATNSPLAQLGKALDSGDLSGAQQIAKSMKSKDTSSTAAISASSASSETVSSNTQTQTQAATSTAADLASELMSDFTSASSALGLGSVINKLV